MTPLEGLEAYQPAPDAVERPAWVVMEGEFWARVDGVCRPVLVEDAASARLEITTCADGALTCGVVASATDVLTLDHAWCLRNRNHITAPLEPSRRSLVAGDAQSARYTRVVQLGVEPIGPWEETQPCSHASLRAMRSTARQLGEPQPTEEVRTCSGTAGWRVRETVESTSSETPVMRVSNDPVDCRGPCPPGLRESRAEATAQVSDRWFIPADAPSLAFYRTADACRAATDTSPTGLPSDVCTTLGAKLP